MNEELTIEVNDIVIVTADITFTDDQGNEVLNLRGREGRVMYVFTDWNNVPACILDLDGFQSPFRMSDIELKEKAMKPEEDIEEEYTDKCQIDKETYHALMRLGILDKSVRSYNKGSSNYSHHIIQPWSIWQDWNLNPWDADIVKRVLRTKQGDARRLDYDKIIHICEERIRQIDNE